MNKFNVKTINELTLQGGSTVGNFFHWVGTGIHNAVTGFFSGLFGN